MLDSGLHKLKNVLRINCFIVVTGFFYPGGSKNLEFCLKVVTVLEASKYLFFFNRKKKSFEKLIPIWSTL